MLISRMLSATMIAGAPDADPSPPADANRAHVLAPMPVSRLGMIARRRPHARAGRGQAQAAAGGRTQRSSAAHSH
jgi:hypothetical protein